MATEMNYGDEADRVRRERPPRVSLVPDPRPFVGEIRLLRRKDGSYLVAALDYDGQAAIMPDGDPAAEVVPRQQVAERGDEDPLAAAIARAHGALDQLRLESALNTVATLGAPLGEEALVTRLRAALKEQR